MHTSKLNFQAVIDSIRGLSDCSSSADLMMMMLEFHLKNYQGSMIYSFFSEFNSRNSYRVSDEGWYLFIFWFKMVPFHDEQTAFFREIHVISAP